MKFRSGFERTLNAQLENSGVVFSYESLKLPYTVNHVYLPDFLVVTGAGKTIVIEAKGRFMPGDQGKMLAVKSQHPDIDLRFVFMDANLPVRKGAKVTHGGWATKHGFPWADKKVPIEWIS